jgi:hypothetical protein
MDPQEVNEYISRSQHLIDSSPQMDEANTKAAILRDFLDLLDWEIPTNTQLEYSVEAFGQTYKVDYALILEGTPVAFLEAKGVDTALTADHDEQLSSYMTNKNVNYGILTNGEQYRFFQRRVDASNVNVQRVGDIDLQDLPDRIAVLNAYTKDAIESGEAGKILGRINELREAREALETEKDELATDLAEVLTDRVSDSITSLAESQAKEMIDRVVGDIENEIDDNGADRVESNIDASGSVPTSCKEVDADNIYYIRFVNSEGALAEFKSKQQNEAFIEAVNYLIEKHDLLSELETLPYIPGRIRPIIHEETSSDDKEMAQPRELSQGYYLETNLSSIQKRRELERLVDPYRFDVTFDGNW